MIHSRPSFEVGATLLVKRIAQRLAGEGARHPLTAAVAVAIRGRHRLDQDQYAQEIGVPLEAVQAAEAGNLAFEQLPGPIATRAQWLGIDLGRLG